MGKKLFTKAVDKSLLRAGMTIPKDKQDEIARWLGRPLARGEKTDVDILINGAKYKAVYTHVALKVSTRDVYQIRYSESNPICSVLKAHFGTAEQAKTEEACIEVWAGEQHCLEFRFPSDSIKQAFMEYLGPEDSLYGYQKSYKLVFYKCYFSEALYGETVNADLLTRLFRQFYIDRLRDGDPVELGNVDQAVAQADRASVDSTFSLILRNPFKAISSKGFFSLKDCDGKQAFAISDELFAALDEQDLQRIRDLISRKLSLYYSRGTIAAAAANQQSPELSLEKPLRNDKGVDISTEADTAVVEGVPEQKKYYGERAWLLTWNPRNWNWNDYAAGLEAARSGEKYEVTWSCSNTHVEAGDQVYLMILGNSEVKGIIAAGQSISKVFDVPHWDPEKAKTGKKTTSIRVSFDMILDFRTDRILELSALEDAFPDQKWDPQASGIAIRGETAPGLRQMWEALISRERYRYKGELELFEKRF